MPRNVHIYVGDKVETTHGVGIVDDVNTWRDRVVEMSEPEAKEFCDVCFREVGLDYKDTWAEVFVSMLSGGMRRFLSTQVKVLVGRDDKAQ